MRRLATAAAALALALLTFLQFPGHTYLQQDSQIYLPILENMRDPSFLRNEILAQRPHVAFTLYDETALVLRRITGLGFREVLAFEQVVTRALGIWGLYLIGAALGFSAGSAVLLAAICSLGATIAGPLVLTVEYEPTPRAFALPLVICAIGLVAHRRYVAAAAAATVGFLYHAPSALPFWALFVVILAIRHRRPWPISLVLLGLIGLAIAARTQGGEAQTLLAQLTPGQEQLQRMRASYVWISMWPIGTIVHYVLAAAIALAGCWRIRHKAPMELQVFLPGLVALGLLSMPLSWLLLEKWKLALIPQMQPLRMVLFITLVMQIVAIAAGLRARFAEAAVWFTVAYLPAVQPLFTQAFPWRRLAVVVGMAAGTALLVSRTPRYAPVAALAAFFAIPALGGVVNYPNLHTRELAELSGWARSHTPRDAVFLFADVPRSYDPGVFRAEALRAVYVDWKGGGQVNYLRAFADQWWFRWQNTLAARFRPAALPKYEALGIHYVVLQPKNRLPREAAFENGKYVVYTATPAVQSK
jgi:hypothetical protein